MNAKRIASVLVPFTAILLVVVLALIYMPGKRTPYAGGELIDANSVTGIVYEEDGDPYELGWRLVKLAVGVQFTEEQVYQIGVLIGGLFEEVRGLGMDVEQLEAQVKILWDRLREQETQAVGGPNGPPRFVLSLSLPRAGSLSGDASPVRV